MTNLTISQITARIQRSKLRKDPQVRGFFNDITAQLFPSLKNVSKKERAVQYLTGLLFAGNKSITGIAKRVHANPDALNHFITNTRWDAQEALIIIAKAALAAAEKQGLYPVAYSLDDTQQQKWGTKSPGVAMQFSNRYGGRVICQAFLTLNIVFADGRSFPVGVSLSAPSLQWSRQRCEEAGIPASLIGLTKPEIGIKLVDEALAAGLPRLPILADTAYGKSTAFRYALEERAIGYLLDVQEKTVFYAPDAPRKVSRRGSPPASRVGVLKSAAKWLAHTPWRVERGRRFQARWVRPGGKATLDLYRVVEPPPLFLVRESSRRKADRYSVSNLSEAEALALLGKRWGIECNYRELKQLTGFVNYQGRSYNGLMRHLALSAVAHVFLFWVALYKSGITLYGACRELPASILLVWHARCPLCKQKLTGYG